MASSNFKLVEVFVTLLDAASGNCISSKRKMTQGSWAG